MKKNEKYTKNTKNILILLLMVFIAYVYDFFVIKGYESKLGYVLFKMVIVLFLAIGMLHKKEIKEMNHQTFLDDYFKKDK